ncbi:copper amine oxidase N-terminal domain-containing protein [Agathobaculum sp.]|uniref:copper amine oxidase N-terminal domain-containing protein n=1 Tax=Agathobaculum sp. TaxID=2048138 RepID=UPI002A7FBCE2|nr:copper amine oxidase N-terminal domain-containing protein [Agathobaculum sp.]MDY3619390.1 copper amine oxidase N-terminal domain-containing protein [Agathobaculum sp.]
MRISELFDELDPIELDSLLAEPLPKDEPDLSSRGLRRRVNDALDEDPAERRRHMKQLFKKGVAAALIAASLITASVAAYQADFWKAWFEGGTGDLEVNTEKQSIDNGDIRLTLEQSLADSNMTFVVYSLTALTDQGKTLLYDENYVEGIDCAVSASYKSSDEVISYSMGAFPEQDTPEQRFYSLSTSDYAGPVTLHLRGSAEVITVPRTDSLQPVKVDLKNAKLETPDGARYTLHSLELTAMTYQLHYTCTYLPEFDGWFEPEDFLCFAMKDGTMKTVGQFGLEHRSGGDESSGVSTGYFSPVCDPASLEGIVVDGTEYFVDGRAGAAYPMPYDIRPIEMPTIRIDIDGKEFLGTPLRPLIERLGGTVTWDSKTQSASVVYRGVTCVLTDGSTGVTRDGKRVDGKYSSMAAKVIGGTMYVESNALENGLDISVISYRLRNAGFDYFHAEDGDSTIWYVVP